jgi:hypothetical protein
MVVSKLNILIFAGKARCLPKRGAFGSWFRWALSANIRQDWKCLPYSTTPFILLSVTRKITLTAGFNVIKRSLILALRQNKLERLPTDIET